FGASFVSSFSLIIVFRVLQSLYLIENYGCCWLYILSSILIFYLVFVLLIVALVVLFVIVNLFE
nr:hypothetical protein [Shewanella shenzhenensis]